MERAEFLLKHYARRKRAVFLENEPACIVEALPRYFSACIRPCFLKACPLFIRGSRPNMKNQDIPRLKTLFPNASVVTIDGAGHWVHADKPQELLTALKEFLEVV